MSIVDHEARSDGRSMRRGRTLKVGVISFAGGQCALPCAIKDLTEDGARVEYTGTVPLPETFRLIIKSDGLEATCTVAWRHRSSLGLRFSDGLQKSVSAAKKKRSNVILEW